MRGQVLLAKPALISAFICEQIKHNVGYVTKFSACEFTVKVVGYICEWFDSNKDSIHSEVIICESFLSIFSSISIL
jgi:hypothetical protein